MGFIVQERASDSPYIKTITHGFTVGDGSTIRPAECHWHMVFVKYQAEQMPIFVAPLTTSGQVSYTEGAEILWIKFKLGTFMPHLLAKKFLDSEVVLPEARSDAFCLKGSAWQFPSFENADTFVNKLVREDILAHDSLVHKVLQGHKTNVSPRTIRHRFLQVTGLSHNHIYQIERAQRAADLLRNGLSILDTVHEAGYFDQPHLTRALKQWVGYTPAQLTNLNKISSAS